MDILKEYLAAVRVKRNLETALKAANKNVDELERAARDYMVENGVGSTKIDGATISPTTRIFARVIKTPDAMERLRDKGLGIYIEETVNANTISAFIREEIASRKTGAGQDDAIIEALVKEFDGVIAISRVNDLSVREG